MPELPEVETIVRTLEKSLLGEKIIGVEFLYPKLQEKDSEFEILSLLGKTFTGFDRRGKYLIFELDHEFYWIVHLRMEGKFHLYKKELPVSKHTHLVLQTKQHWVHYLDVRKFSRMAITKDKDAYFTKKNLGYEPFDSKMDWRYLKNEMSKSNRSIKALLLDQSIVVGIGNIYADEILFETKIHPLKKGSECRNKDFKSLEVAIPKILHQAILQGGTTIRSYTSALNVTGRFQVALKAYGQEGKECANCTTIMTRIKVAGRSTVFCKRCQK